MDVVTFGESMVVFSPDSSGPLRYIHSFNKSIGGAESNLSIALSRLGNSVGWFSKVGDDEFGRYIISTIRGEGVDTSKAIVDGGYPTGLLFKEKFIHENPNVYYYRKGSAASSITPEDLDKDYIASAKILHITGITPAISNSAKETVLKAIDIARENNVLVSFDPNIRLKLWSIEEARPVLLEIASKADIIFPGADEAKLLIGTEEPEEVAREFIKRGAIYVAVKLGAKGCFVADKNSSEFVPGYKVKPIDTVGAGDGFAAGFLTGFLKGKSLKDCGMYGNGVGALATLVKGDCEGFPSFDQLLEFMGEKTIVSR
ncbi:MAG TPA: sugar kinase [Clostridiaceae bacterium]